jgi:tetratricopeptide (TPR) repeat protein
VLSAVAAIGCSAFLLYRTYDKSAATVPGNPAAAALVQTPALAQTQDPLAPAATATGTAQPNPNTPGSESSESAAPAPTAERTSAGARRTSAPREADLTTAAGRARSLVDSGAAMLKQGRLGLAEGMYMKALQEVPEYPAALAELVRVHLARRDGTEAVRWAERLVAKQNNALHQLLLGDAQALRGNSGAAVAAWTKSAEAGNTTARQRLGNDEDDEDDEDE